MSFLVNCGKNNFQRIIAKQYFRLKSNFMDKQELSLKYGCNPYQTPARIFVSDGCLPIDILNGNPSYINLLDALNSWQLVKELRQIFSLPAAASFKHVSPAGAAVGVPLTDELKLAYFVDNSIELSPLATAYARARGADRVSSFGDWVALSDTVDLDTAKLLRYEVSDGIIAPGYDSEALTLLKQKRRGNYVIVQIDPNYQPPLMETKEVFGIKFEQKRNNSNIGYELLDNVVTSKKQLSPEAKRDSLIALVVLKYTQSNSVCVVFDGQIIGLGAGQQSRIQCTRSAIAKAETWYLRQHPKVLNLKFRSKIPRPERDNAVEMYVRSDLIASEERILAEALITKPDKLTVVDKRQWLNGFKGATLGSDGYIPFRDNVDYAQRLGISYIIEPGGSLRDDDIIAACNEYGMTMVFSNLRLFHH